MDFGLEKHFFLQQSNKNILYKILYHLLVLQEPGSEITKRAVILFEYYLNIVNLTLYTSNLSLFHSILKSATPFPKCYLHKEEWTFDS